MDEPVGARHLVGPRQQRDLAGLGHVLGIGLDEVRPGDVLARERHRLHAAATTAGGGRRRPSGLGQTGLGQVGRVGEPGGVADDHPDAGASIAPGGELLDLAVVEHGGRRPLVLGEDLGEVAAGLAGRCRARG